MGIAASGVVGGGVVALDPALHSTVRTTPSLASV